MQPPGEVLHAKNAEAEEQEDSDNDEELENQRVKSDPFRTLHSMVTKDLPSSHSKMVMMPLYRYPKQRQR
jgi:hypothetical protein